MKWLYVFFLVVLPVVLCQEHEPAAVADAGSKTLSGILKIASSEILSDDGHTTEPNMLLTTLFETAFASFDKNNDTIENVNHETETPFVNMETQVGNVNISNESNDTSYIEGTTEMNTIISRFLNKTTDVTNTETNEEVTTVNSLGTIDGGNIANEMSTVQNNEKEEIFTEDLQSATEKISEEINTTPKTKEDSTTEESETEENITEKEEIFTEDLQSATEKISEEINTTPKTKEDSTNEESETEENITEKEEIFTEDLQSATEKISEEINTTPETKEDLTTEENITENDLLAPEESKIEEIKPTPDNKEEIYTEKPQTTIFSTSTEKPNPISKTEDITETEEITEKLFITTEKFEEAEVTENALFAEELKTEKTTEKIEAIPEYKEEIYIEEPQTRIPSDTTEKTEEINEKMFITTEKLEELSKTEERVTENDVLAAEEMLATTEKITNEKFEEESKTEEITMLTTILSSTSTDKSEIIVKTEEVTENMLTTKELINENEEIFTENPQTTILSSTTNEKSNIEDNTQEMVITTDPIEEKVATEEIPKIEQTTVNIIETTTEFVPSTPSIDEMTTPLTTPKIEETNFDTEKSTVVTEEPNKSSEIFTILPFSQQTTEIETIATIIPEIKATTPKIEEIFINKQTEPLSKASEETFNEIEEHTIKEDNQILEPSEKIKEIKEPSKTEENVADTVTEIIPPVKNEKVFALFEKIEAIDEASKNEETTVVPIASEKMFTETEEHITENVQPVKIEEDNKVVVPSEEIEEIDVPLKTEEIVLETVTEIKEIEEPSKNKETIPEKESFLDYASSIIDRENEESNIKEESTTKVNFEETDKSVDTNNFEIKENSISEETTTETEMEMITEEIKEDKDFEHITTESNFETVPKIIFVESNENKNKDKVLETTEEITITTQKAEITSKLEETEQIPEEINTTIKNEEIYIESITEMTTENTLVETEENKINEQRVSETTTEQIGIISRNEEITTAAEEITTENIKISEENDENLPEESATTTEKVKLIFEKEEITTESNEYLVSSEATEKIPTEINTTIKNVITTENLIENSEEIKTNKVFKNEENETEKTATTIKNEELTTENIIKIEEFQTTEIQEETKTMNKNEDIITLETTTEIFLEEEITTEMSRNEDKSNEKESETSAEKDKSSSSSSSLSSSSEESDEESSKGEEQENTAAEEKIFIEEVFRKNLVTTEQNVAEKEENQTTISSLKNEDNLQNLILNPEDFSNMVDGKLQIVHDITEIKNEEITTTEKVMINEEISKTPEKVYVIYAESVYENVKEDGFGNKEIVEKEEIEESLESKENNTESSSSSEENTTNEDVNGVVINEIVNTNSNEPENKNKLDDVNEVTENYLTTTEAELKIKQNEILEYSTEINVVEIVNGERIVKKLEEYRNRKLLGEDEILNDEPVKKPMSGDEDYESLSSIFNVKDGDLKEMDDSPYQSEDIEDISEMFTEEVKFEEKVKDTTELDGIFTKKTESEEVIEEKVEETVVKDEDDEEEDATSTEEITTKEVDTTTEKLLKVTTISFEKNDVVVENNNSVKEINKFKSLENNHSDINVIKLLLDGKFGNDVKVIPKNPTNFIEGVFNAKPYNFTLGIETENGTIFVPGSASLFNIECGVNITWRNDKNSNNSITLQLNNKEYEYLDSITIEVVKKKKTISDKFITKSHDLPKKEDQLFVFPSGVTLRFSNLDFLENLCYLQDKVSLKQSGSFMGPMGLNIMTVLFTVLIVSSVILYYVLRSKKNKAVITGEPCATSSKLQV
ncbi:unnamed protein product [Brassicogethes aeneus]|uniref:Uncharacterized protein n=1 Tax=Brassicogethes aeneus TaxID=1431903 RepID=A0A9P0FN07_BRAAE|nr:unnamed protein product [Brassicogethes aeneus]